MACEPENKIVYLSDKRETPLSDEQTQRASQGADHRSVVQAVRGGKVFGLTETFTEQCHTTPLSAYDMWLPMGSPEADAYLLEQFKKQLHEPDPF
ncbi:MAG: hypothetical protein ACLFR0_03895 [Alphaproteobacteria bacterium]